MSTSVTLNGASYAIPAVGESSWGSAVTSYLVAAATGFLQKAGGTFTLTADVDFGANFGIKSTYYKSRGTVASAGQIRLGSGESVAWRDAGNTADLALATATDWLQFAGVDLVNLSRAQSLTNKTMTVDGANKCIFRSASGTDRNIVFDPSGAADSKTLTLASAHSNDRTVTFPNATTTLVGRDTVDTLTNKTLTSPTVTGTLLLQNATGAQPELHLSEDPDNGTSKVILKAPAALAGDVTFTLPDNDGGANEVLATDGSGVLSWAAVATTVTTTRGDLIARGASADDRLAIGTAGKRLRSNGTDPAWSWHAFKTLSSGSYTILDDDGFDICESSATSGTVSYTPPAAANNTGRVIHFVQTASGGALEIVGTIGGHSSNNTILAQYGRASIVSNGSVWCWLQDIVEAATWSAVLKEGVNTLSTTGGATYARTGRSATLYFNLNNPTTGGATGILTITGSPFAQVSTAPAVGALYARIVTYSAGEIIVPYLPGGNSAIELVNVTTASNGTSLLASDLAASTSDLWGQITLRLA